MNSLHDHRASAKQVVLIDLPLPPSVNQLYRNAPGRGRVKTDRYKTWINAAGWELKSQRPRRLSGSYALTMLCERKDKRRRDLGNLIKAVEDLLVTHHVVEDDSRCEKIALEWSPVIKGCRVFVEPLSRVEGS